MPLTFPQYSKALRRQFMLFGFVSCPLTSAQIKALWRSQVPTDTAYGVGCDVYAGVGFDEAKTFQSLIAA